MCVSRLTPAGAEAFLSATGRTVWRDRCQRSCIVLVDDHSTMEQLRSHSDAPILALKDAIFKVNLILYKVHVFRLVQFSMFWLPSVICSGRTV